MILDVPRFSQHLFFLSISCSHTSITYLFFFWWNVLTAAWWDAGTEYLQNKALTSKPSRRSCSPSTKLTASSTPSKCCRRKSSWRKKRYFLLLRLFNHSCEYFTTLTVIKKVLFRPTKFFKLEYSWMKYIYIHKSEHDVANKHVY